MLTLGYSRTLHGRARDGERAGICMYIHTDRLTRIRTYIQSDTDAEFRNCAVGVIRNSMHHNFNQK